MSDPVSQPVAQDAAAPHEADARRGPPAPPPPQAQTVMIETPAGVAGLPSHVQALYLPGATPELRGVKELLEPWRVAPARRAGAAHVQDLDSFIRLVNWHKDAGSAIFAHPTWEDAALTAILDYHSAQTGPRFGEHRVVYGFQLLDDFKVWLNLSGRVVTIEELRTALEDQILYVVDPTQEEIDQYEWLFQATIGGPAEALRMVRDPEAFAALTAAGPAVFMIEISPFRGAEALRVPVRITSVGENWRWTLNLHRWRQHLSDAVACAARKAAAETGLPLFFGAPEL